jgi:hypothetical protein
MTNCFEFRAALEAVQMSHAELSEMLNVERSTVWRWFRGKREIPRHVMIILSALVGHDPRKLRSGSLHDFHVQRHHVYQGDETFHGLAKRWRPDKTGRNTKAEMQLILRYRLPS